VDWLREALGDPDGYTAFSAAAALATARNSPAAVQALIAATGAPRAAVADRAATSLAKIAQRDEPATRGLRPQMLAALETLFSRMGDGCVRDDREWGYRPAGDALLAFGAEGESVLKRLMAQEQDRRLSELAWRVLYIREKSGENAFNIITEKEDDEAFRARPDWMKTNRVARIRQDFEHGGLFKTNTVGVVGSAAAAAGRWGNFGERGPLVSAARAHGGKQAVKLVRGGDGLVGWVDQEKGVGPAMDLEVHAWVWREATGSLVLAVRDGHGREALSVLVNEEGGVCLRDSSAWKRTPLTVPAETWTKVAVRTSRDRNTFTAAVTTSEGREAGAGVHAALLPAGPVAQVLFSPQGTAGSACYLDDVTAAEIR